MEKALRIIKTIAISAFAFWMTLLAYQPAPASVERPRVETSPYAMIEQCESAEPGDFPGRALIQRVSNGGEWVTSDRLIGKAMEDALGGKDWKNVRVIAFCK